MMADREAKIKITEKKSGRKEPTTPTSGFADKDRLNLADEDLLVMLASGNVLEQAYDSQAAVDVETLIIAEAYYSQATNNELELELTLSRLL